MGSPSVDQWEPSTVLWTWTLPLGATRPTMALPCESTLGQLCSPSPGVSSSDQPAGGVMSNVVAGARPSTSKRVTCSTFDMLQASAHDGAFATSSDGYAMGPHALPRASDERPAAVSRQNTAGPEVR